MTIVIYRQAKTRSYAFESKYHVHFSLTLENQELNINIRKHGFANRCPERFPECKATFVRAFAVEDESQELKLTSEEKEWLQDLKDRNAYSASLLDADKEKGIRHARAARGEFFVRMGRALETLLNGEASLKDFKTALTDVMAAFIKQFNADESLDVLSTSQMVSGGLAEAISWVNANRSGQGSSLLPIDQADILSVLRHIPDGNTETRSNLLTASSVENMDDSFIVTEQEVDAIKTLEESAIADWSRSIGQPTSQAGTDGHECKVQQATSNDLDDPQLCRLVKFMSSLAALRLNSIGSYSVPSLLRVRRSDLYSIVIQFSTLSWVQTRLPHPLHGFDVSFLSTICLMVIIDSVEELI